LITDINFSEKKEKVLESFILLLAMLFNSLKFKVQSSKFENQQEKSSEFFLLITHYSLLVTFLLLFALSSSLFAMTKDRVVASVDNTAITLSEFEEEYSKSLKATPDATKEEVLNAMINRVLLLREAKKTRLEEPSDDELLKEYVDLKLRTFVKIKEKNISDFYQNHTTDFQGKEFESVREEIEKYLVEAELNSLLKAHIEELRKKAYIRIQLEYIRNGK
jgi:hypothetical protein